MTIGVVMALVLEIRLRLVAVEFAFVGAPVVMAVISHGGASRRTARHEGTGDADRRMARLIRFGRAEDRRLARASRSLHIGAPAGPGRRSFAGLALLVPMRAA